MGLFSQSHSSVPTIWKNFWYFECQFRDTGESNYESEPIFELCFLESVWIDILQVVIFIIFEYIFFYVSGNQRDTRRTDPKSKCLFMLSDLKSVTIDMSICFFNFLRILTILRRRGLGSDKKQANSQAQRSRISRNPRHITFTIFWIMTKI